MYDDKVYIRDEEMDQLVILLIVCFNDYGCKTIVTQGNLN